MESDEKVDIQFGEENVKKTKYCKKCGSEMDIDIKFCPKCGSNQEELNNNQCPNCGAKIKENSKFCDSCGSKLDTMITEPNISSDTQQTNKTNQKKSPVLAIVLSVVGVVVLLIIIIAVAVGLTIKKTVDYENLPVKVDVSMSNYYGSIDYILEDFGLDFDLVTKGGNCYSGVQTGSFETEKYGILHTEYSYCKSNQTLTLRVYNLEKDQKLREPKDGEVPLYDLYGKRISDYSI